MADRAVERRLLWSSRVRHALTSREWLRLSSMFLAIFALHAVGWLTLLLVVVPAHYSVGDKVLGVGIGMTAYALGMRHAFDADHIAAIDNTTRKLMGDGQRPLAVGFFFSLGHSTVVFGLTALLAFGVTAVVGPVQDDSSALHHYTALIGTAVSGIFLYVIAIANLVILVGIVRVFVQMRDGTYNDSELEEHLNNRGFLNRYLGRFTRSIKQSWHTYPLGVLFGLGFDTASEVALLVVAGTSVAAGVPWYAILCLPVLFAAGMTLLDTIDGSFMNLAYGWALSEPVRKVYYNLTLTAMSVAIALIVGSIELLGVLVAQLGWTGGAWDWVGDVDLNIVGFVVVGVFVATWIVALVVWKYAHVEEKWAADRRE